MASSYFHILKARFPSFFKAIEGDSSTWTALFLVKPLSATSPSTVEAPPYGDAIPHVNLCICFPADKADSGGGRCCNDDKCASPRSLYVIIIILLFYIFIYNNFKQ